jgi:hypothetical protein
MARDRVLEALKSVVEYMYEPEMWDYEALPKAAQEGRIFISVRLLARFLEGLAAGRYVIVERKVLQRMAEPTELGDCVKALLADSDIKKEE